MMPDSGPMRGPAPPFGLHADPSRGPEAFRGPPHSAYGGSSAASGFHGVPSRQPPGPSARPGYGGPMRGPAPPDPADFHSDFAGLPARGGQPAAQSVFQQVASDVAAVSGRLRLRGRFHQAPRSVQDDYEVSSQSLGSGLNGDVLLGATKEGSGGVHVAIKTLPLAGVSPLRRDEIESEVRVFLCVDHPHIVRLYDIYETEHCLHLVMECLHGGELYNRVLNEGFLQEPAASGAARQMLLALGYLHLALGVAHRDLKLENFLCDRPGSAHIKLIDFGLSTFIGRSGVMQATCGTAEYVAPEVLEGRYTTQCDVWSLGVIAYIMLSGTMPWNGVDTGPQRKSKLPDAFLNSEGRWAQVSYEAKSFVNSALRVDEGQRLTVEKALQHPWIVGYSQANPGQNQVVHPSVVASLRAWPKADRFHRICVSMMAWTLSNEEHATVRQQFFALDAQRVGCVRLQDLKKAFAACPPHASEDRPSDAALVLQAFEALHSPNAGQEPGVIQYSDFLAAVTRRDSYIVPSDDSLRAAFRRFDFDGLNRITVDDLRHLLGDSFEGARVEDLLNEADLSHRGFVDYNDFAAYARGFRKSGAATPAQAFPSPPVGPGSELERLVERLPMGVQRGGLPPQQKFSNNQADQSHEPIVQRGGPEKRECRSCQPGCVAQ